MTDNSFIPAAQLNFDAYKESLKAYLKQQDRFKDYDFEGSNMSALIDLLTYNTVNNATYLNMVGSESFLDSAVLRPSIVSRAKELNYTPRSRVSARTTLTVEIVPSDTPSSIIIPKGYKFKSATAVNKQINFVTTQSYVVQRNSEGRYVKTGVEAREGEIVTEFFDVEASTESGYTTYEKRFVMQSDNIDIDSLEVQVFETADSTVYTSYTRAFNVYGLSGNSMVFFVRGYGANQYEIEFGDGSVGRALKTGNRIKVLYRDTLGAEANGRLAFARTAAIDGYSNILITVTENPNGGAERESNESIKFNSPRFYQTQERGVIDEDFKTLIRDNFPEVQSSHVYGGEKIKKYGNVVVAVKPEGTNGRASTSLKKRLKAFLETKTLVTGIIVVDPTYFIVKLSARVLYDLNLVTTNTDNVRTTILNKLMTYSATSMANFGVSIFTSKLESIIEQADTSVIGSEIDMSLVYQWIPVQVNVPETLTINTGNQLLTSSNTDYAIRSAPFYVLTDAGDATVQVYAQDDRSGSVHLYNHLTGVLYKSSVGTVDYTTGVMSVNLTVQGYDQSAINWTFNLEKRQADIQLNQFAILDSEYITIDMDPK